MQKAYGIPHPRSGVYIQIQLEEIELLEPRRYGRLISTSGALAAGGLAICAVVLAVSPELRIGLLALGLLILGSGLFWDAREQTRQRSALAERTERLEAEKADVERLLSAAVSSQLRAGVNVDVKALIGELSRALGADIAVCYVLQRESGVLTPVATAGMAGSALSDLPLGPQADDQVNQVLSSGVPVAKPGSDRGAHRLLPRSVEAESILLLPMMIDDGPVGLIVLAAREPDRFSDKDIELAGATAASCATAIYNERLISNSRQALRHSTVVKEVALAVNSTLELSHILHLFLGKARGIVDYDRAAVALFEGESFRVAALVDAEGQRHRRPPNETQGRVVGSVYEGVRGGSIVARKLLGADDAFATQHPAEVRLGDAYSEVLVPLRSKGEVVGCVAFRSPTTGGFPEGLSPALYELANLGGMAITNSMVHAGTASQARHLDLLLNSLSEVSRKLTATTEGPTALERRTVATVAHLFDSPFAVLSRIGDGLHQVVATHGLETFEA
ncbi:MAG: GAF domain-containing protein, partial [Candidatus Dormibacteria bacterium]